MAFSWQNLVKTSLLGTERSQLAAPDLEWLEAQGVDVDDNESVVILQALALQTQLRRAAFEPDTYADGENPADGVAEGDWQVCSPKSSHHLKLILEGKFADALPEFIHFLKANKKQLPPESLPDLLDQCLENGEFREKLLPVLGIRAKWLMSLHPAWQRLGASADWENGSKQQRVAHLVNLRKSDPAAGLDLLKSIWKKEKVKDKVAFLKALETGLSDQDEAFLETQLDNRRKEIRRASAQLLAKLPSSALVERMFQRVVPLLKIKKDKLTITLPDEPDEAALRDGILSAWQIYSGGLKAGRLAQMLSAIPPVRWETHFDRSASDCLKLWLKGGWKDAVLYGLIRATTTFPNVDWQEAILNYWNAQAEESIWQQPIMADFINSLSNREVNAACLRFLRQKEGLMEEDAAASQLLMAGKHRWEEALTLRVVRGFQTWLNDSTAHYWNTWHYRKLLLTAAYHSPPSVLEKVKKGWNYNNPNWRNWQKEVENFQRALLFRQEMRKALER